MRRRTGIIFMIVGALLLGAALSLFLRNKAEDEKAGERAERVLEKLTEETPTGEPDTYDQLVQNTPGEDTGIGAEGKEMATVVIEGESYIGYLTIPTLGLELPVMAEWNYNRLRTAPCRYSGSAWTEDLVIAAHNYTEHFGNLSSLNFGDVVYFTDVDGHVFSYQVVETSTLEAEAVEEVTDGKFALTLFTCTYGGAARVTVRCRVLSDTF